MRIEQASLALSQTRDLKLSDLQHQYLGALHTGMTIEQLVVHYLQQGWLVSFGELLHALKSALAAQRVGNAGVAHYLNAYSEPTKEFGGARWLSSKTSAKPLASTEIPFLRSLNPETRQVLLAQAKRIQIKAKTQVCQQGSAGRDLYAVTLGSCGVYRRQGQQHQLVAQLDAGAVFGEAGFFLNQPRSADIFALIDVELLQIPWRPEWQNLMNSDKAQSLQIRFWVQHALASSSFFKSIPPDCLDSLSMMGRPVQLGAQQMLFAEGSPGNKAYLVIQGGLVVSQGGKAIRQLKQGDFLGEISLMRSGGLRTATVHAVTNTLLLEIDQQSFFKLLSLNLFLAVEIEKLAQQRLQDDAQRRS